MPLSIQYLVKDSFAVLRDLISDPRMTKHMTWKSKKLYTKSGDRVYEDQWSDDWW